MNLLQIETPVHGRVLLEDRGDGRLLVGFHGYAETAEIHMAELEKIPGIGEWSVAAIQALHPFYSKGGTVIGGNWMTSQDRELAIADNINYVRRALAALPQAGTTVFLGFSQGAAMAARAAAAIPCAGLILLGGDIPPDVREAKLPPLLLARGVRDDWYTEAKFKEDLRFVTPARTLVFEGGHEFSDEFRTAAGEFLQTLSRSHQP
jgi:pimeloyl-ACP methyl ester carboxylesterase